MADVEMKKTEDKSKPDESKQEEEKPPVPLTPLQEVKANVTLIDRAVANLEPRFTHRVLRTLSSLRKKLDENIIRNAIDELYLRGMYSEYTVARKLSYILNCRQPNEKVAIIMAS
jgi:26S proteasome regulatory subunit N3